MTPAQDTQRAEGAESLRLFIVFNPEGEPVAVSTDGRPAWIAIGAHTLKQIYKMEDEGFHLAVGEWLQFYPEAPDVPPTGSE